MALEDVVRLIDVGALGGLDKKWSPHLDRLWPILFEPNQHEADKLRRMNIPRATIIETALSSSTGERTLYITRNPACVSLLHPNSEFLRQYAVHVHFEVVETRNINCVRYDELFRSGEVPAPDVIKIDAQGFEYQILLGFGHLLNDVLAIELETHLYPIYQNQKTLADIVKLLDVYDFSLKEMRQSHPGHFDQDLVEIDAFFAKRRRVTQSYSPKQKDKLALVSSVWNIQP